MNKQFKLAKPIWAKSQSKEMNKSYFFTAKLNKNSGYYLKITANNFYRIFIDGKFFSYGPARAAHYYYRVDNYNLEISNKDRVITIEVVGYNCRSFYSLETEPFILAEIYLGESVFYATGTDKDFDSYNNSYRKQLSPRFSYQRAFSEIYNYDIEFNYCNFSNNDKIETEIIKDVKLLERNIGYPLYLNKKADLVEFGTYYKENTNKRYDNRFLTNTNIKIFDKKLLEPLSDDFLINLEYKKKDKLSNIVGENMYLVYKTEYSYTGFINLKIKANIDSKFYIIFDEINSSKEKDKPIDICFYRNDTYNIIEYSIVKGNYDLLSFEPYTARYIKVVVEKGEIEINECSIISYENGDTSRFKFNVKDDKLNKIVNAAVATFKQNSVDILTDCPSRERAGWLCDSYFSSQAEELFTGYNRIENNFLENYTLIEKLDNIPDGMIPMCYPADFSDENMYIPNWSLWYLIELYDNYKRTNNYNIALKSKSKVEGLLNYFKKFENDDELLENLKGWIFIEWSKANDNEFIKGVNYPSNMIYALALEKTGKLYKEKSLIEKAERIREKIREQSFNGEFFEDNAIKENGKLERLGHTSETCQYYAFFTKIATIETYKELWDKLYSKFGPLRKENVDPNVYKSNAFIGNYLRIILLNNIGDGKEVAKESVEYFLKMAELTGTLWEHDQIYGSLDHCFASFIALPIVSYITGYQGIKNGEPVFSKNYAKIDGEIELPIKDKVIKIIIKNGEINIIF